MDHTALIAHIQRLKDMPQVHAAEIAKVFEYVEVAKDACLIQPGSISQHSFFLESGFLRTYTFDPDGHEVTTRLFSAPAFANDYLSYFQRQPAKEYLQAITDCVIWQIPYEAMQQAFHQLPHFREMGRMMLTYNYVHLHSQMLSMVQQTAEDRYLQLVEAQPGIIQNVPLKIIASYLGITDSSLSRIRRDIRKRVI